MYNSVNAANAAPQPGGIWAEEKIMIAGFVLTVTRDFGRKVTYWVPKTKIEAAAAAFPKSYGLSFEKVSRKVATDHHIKEYIG